MKEYKRKQTNRYGSQQSGFTLIEMLIALSVFSILIIVSFNIFYATIQAQQGLTASQDIDESLKFVMEVMSKEIRDAKDNAGTCNADIHLNSSVNKVYNIDNSNQEELAFNNNDGTGVCVKYYISGNRLYIKRGADPGLPVTPNKINIQNLKFRVYDDLQGDFRAKQAYVTMSFDVSENLGKYLTQPVRVQTTVTSRYYGN